MNRKLLLIVCIVITALLGYYFFYNQKGESSSKKVVIKVGVLTPLSGENATYGEATNRGLEIALAEISKKEEYKNFQIELVKEDTKLEAAKAVSGIQKLISVNKVPVIIGPFGSSEVLAVAQSANTGRTPIISASATADAIASAGDYVFRIVPANKEQGTSMADFVVNQLYHKDSIAVIALNNDYGISLSTSFKNRINELGGKIFFEDKFDEKAKDFRTLITKVKSVNPSFIYLPDHYNEAGLFLKQARELDLNCPIGGGDGSYSPDLISIAGIGAEGFYLTLMGIDNTNSNTKAFEDAYKAKYNKDVDVYSAYAYDVLYLVAEVLRQIPENELVKLDGVLFTKYLNTIKFQGITGLTSFDSKGEVTKAFKLYSVKDSEFIVVINQ